MYTSRKEVVVRFHNTEFKKHDTSTWQDELAAKYRRTEIKKQDVAIYLYNIEHIF
jgi:hypothetical protein